MRRALICAFASCAFAACGGSDPTLDDVQNQVFVGCTQPTCHSTSAKSGDLVLTPEMARAQLVGVESDNPEAKARGLLRVKPGSPSESFLLIKMTPPVEPDLGGIMPAGTNGLDAATLQLVEDWIAAGAP